MGFEILLRRDCHTEDVNPTPLFIYELYEKFTYINKK